MEFLSNSNYYSQINKFFENDEDIDIAVAFWGKDAIKLFKNISDKKIRIICNLESGACNPKVIKELKNNSIVELKTNNHLHAKVLLQNSQVIIGSANISANGLSFEDSEQSGWIETGILSQHQQLIENTQKWFDKTWEESSEITSELMNTAEKNWQKKRTNRLLVKSDESLLGAAFKDIEKFNDRNIYFAIYRNELSNEATAKLKQVTVEYSNSDLKEKIDCYEEWSELPDNAYLIDLYYGPRKDFQYCGINSCPEEPISCKFKDKNNNDAKIKIVFKKKSIHGYKITRKDQELIKKGISKLWSYQLRNEDTTIVPFIDGVKILKKII